MHYFESLGIKVTVIEDKDVNLQQTDWLHEFDGIVLSPGPGLPKETKSMFPILEYCAYKIPVFGVCLGMQGIAELEGGQMQNLASVRHGKKKSILHDGRSTVFAEIPSKFDVGLYHSWSITGLNESIVMAKDDEGIIMAIENNESKRYGVQFHPESILTEYGHKIIQNVAFKIFS